MTRVQPIPAEIQGGLAASIAPDLALVEQGVAWFSGRLRDSLAGELPITEMVTEAYTSVLEGGGKRVRGGLTVAGYDMYGGENQEVASRAAGIVEGVQAMVLVMDDVSDQSDTRRGGPAAHVLIERGLRGRMGASGPLGVMAMDLAVNTAMGVHSQIQILLSELDVPPNSALSAIRLVNNRLVRTGGGQIMDIFSATGVPLSEDEILKIAKDKTAYYSFELPIELGAVLAGGDDAEFPRIRRYSEAAGLAFQLHDDVMGTFGDEKKMGKSAKSDIGEGKQTLLMLYAKMAATDTERAVLEAALGNREMTDEQFADCKAIIERTGAKLRIENLALAYSDQAHDALSDPPELWKPERVAQLHTVASFVVGRSI